MAMRPLVYSFLVRYVYYALCWFGIGRFRVDAWTLYLYIYVYVACNEYAF